MPDERDLTPEQEARVARLLADARAEEPVPPEVSARLDRVLAGLAGESVDRPPDRRGQVSELAARRRRRVRTLLVAAAAVVVVGVGVGQLVGQDEGADGGAATSSDAGEGTAPRQGVQPERAESPDEAAREELESLGEPRRITKRSFARAVRQLQGRPGVRSPTGATLMDDSDLAAPEMGFRCAPTDFGPGKLIAVRYQGDPAVLVYRPPAGDTQVVDLMQCRSGDILRSTTIPLP